jgi:GNAT superfamily N-acetyltransferase
MSAQGRPKREYRSAQRESAPLSAAPESLFRLRALTGEPAEMAALQAVLEAAPRYFEAVCGGPPGPAEAQSTFTALPPGRSYDDKRVFGLYAGDAMIGAADVVRGWNAPDKAIIGLLLLAEGWQRRGIGRAFAALIEQAILAWPEIATLRVGVVASNPDALAFWRRLGYRETGEVRPAAPPFVAEIVVLEKPLARGDGAG